MDCLLQTGEIFSVSLDRLGIDGICYIEWVFVEWLHPVHWLLCKCGISSSVESLCCSDGVDAL
jgi:hypothetical protein